MGAENMPVSNGAQPVYGNNSLIVADEGTRQHALISYEPTAQVQEEEDVVHLRDYWRIVVKHRWVVLSFLSIVLTATLIASLLMRPVYKATATVQIDEDLPNILKYQDVQPDRPAQANFYPTQYKILQSRSLAKSVIDKLDLTSAPEINGAVEQRGMLSGLDHMFTAIAGTRQAAEEANVKDADTASPQERAASKLVTRFLDKLDIQPERNSKLVKVSFSSFDPRLAAEVANAVVAAYIESTMQRRYDSGSEAREFLQKQLINMQAALERSDQALQDFARKKNVADLEERLRLASNKLKELNDKLTEVQVEKVNAAVMRQQILKGKVETLDAMVNNELLNALQKEYVAAAAEHAKMSGQFKSEYPAVVQLGEQMGQLQAQINKEKRRVSESITAKYSRLSEQDDALRNAVNAQEEQIMSLNQEAVQYNILKREVQANKELYDGLLQRMKEVGVSSGIRENNISVIDKAEVPVLPDKPNKRLNMLLALFLGLSGGIGIAFLLEHLDNTVRRSEDIESLLGLPTLGMIPLHRSRHSKKRKIMLGNEEISFYSLNKPKSAISEAFRSVRTSLMFSSPAGMPKVLLMTSSVPSEGKTASSVNFATVLAQSGGRVLVIDADLRRPRLHKVFNKPSVPGLTQLIARKEGTVASSLRGTEISGVFLLPSGTVPPNPAELLGAESMSKVIEECRTLFDYVIIDSAPVLGLADALLLSRLVDGVVLMVAAGSTSKDNLKYAVKRLRQVRAPVLGVILNAVDLQSPDYSYYSGHYYNYYGEDGEHRPHLQEGGDQQAPKLAHEG